MARLLALLFALLMPGLAAAAHIEVRLVPESAGPRAGARTTLAFVMTPQPTWHGYWQNPGDAGVETRVAWTAPPGLRFGPIRYPVPETLLIAGLMNHVYEARHTLLVDLDIPAGLAPGTKLPIRAKLDWLACNPSICVPETATLATTLTIGDGAETTSLDAARAALPRPLGSPGTYQVEKGRFRLAVPLPAAATADSPHFFALTDGAIDYAAPQTAARDGDRLVIETAARAGWSGKGIEGVVRLGPGAGLALTAAPGIVPPASADAAATGDLQTALLAFLGAAAGGLLLNIMPCVFPILSLKAMSLARAGGDERGARAEALAYAGGVVLVCLALGGILLGLRAGGQAAGWAFQLQDPRVILALMLLTLAIGLNLAGLFELPMLGAGGGLAARGGVGGAFWTGALAAFIATPCTGPFMGAALGAALVLPAAAALAIFAGLGLGLALPFLALGFVPALRRMLPKPGAWMDRFRAIMAVPMLVTALGLAWILGRQAGVDGMTAGLAAALIVALGLWWAGRRQAGGRTGVWWPVLPALLAAVALTVAVPRAGVAQAATEAAPGEEPYSDARLAALRQQGRPVFAYFTADWCLTCKVNERTALHRAETEAAFARARVAVLVGDWTRGDPALTRVLERHGRSGVPLYLWYPAGAREPRVLPQVLTVGLLTGL